MKLIVGLGNIGAKYYSSRHNVGFLIIEQFAANYSNSIFQMYSRYNAEMARVRIGDNDVLLLKPSTYMNLSGTAVAAVKNYFKIDIKDLLVVHDDIDLVPHHIKVKVGGGNAGHNGLRSITQCCGNDYKRLRYGIGRPAVDSKINISDYVLGDLEPEFLLTLKHNTNIINDAINQNI